MSSDQQTLEPTGKAGGNGHSAASMPPSAAPRAREREPDRTQNEALSAETTGRVARTANRAREFSRQHPWWTFGSAIGVGAALAVGIRHIPDIPDGAVARTTRRARDSGVAAVLGGALLRLAINVGMRKLDERMDR